MTKNHENYCTLEIARRLQETGIVLETEKYFYKGLSAEDYETYDKKDLSEGLIKYSIPRPSMAEAWRELPERRTINTCICEISFTKVGPFHVACYSWFYEAMSPLFKTTNPTDALCELLLWGKGQKDGR